jgi:hypothetical protein
MVASIIRGTVTQTTRATSITPPYLFTMMIKMTMIKLTVIIKGALRIGVWTTPAQHQLETIRIIMIRMKKRAAIISKI